MVDIVDMDLTHRVTNWIINQAQTQNVVVTVYNGKITRDNNWLHVPVAVNQEGDAYDRATWLQRIEDAWNPESFDGLQLLIVPAKPDTPTKTNLYSQVGDLMQRQHLLLEQIAQDGENTDNIQRFQSIRQEWERTLTDMAQLYPSLKTEVV